VPLPTHGHGRRHGEGIVVGHPDTGYTDHPELADARLLVNLGFDFLEDDPDARDGLDGKFPGHGTGTASVIVSGPMKSNGTGVFGAAPKARLVPLRVSKSVVHLSFENVADAIHLAVDRGCHVISMSLGGPIGPKFLHRAVRRAVEEGVVVLAAAGNVWPFVVFPARYDEVVAVAASNCDDMPWKGSAHGPDVDISAPGESVWRATAVAASQPKFDVAQGNGTSFAVAATAGACALWLAHHGRDRLVEKYGKAGVPAVFKEILLATARVPAQWKKKEYGAGVLNAEALLSAPLPDTAPAARFRRASPAAARRSLSQMEEFLPYFPGEDPESLRRGLVAALGLDEREAAMILTEHRDELLFHVGTDPQLRDDVRSAPRRGAPARAARRSVAGAPAPAAPLKLPRRASARLRRALSSK
jgi:thermitase